MKKVLIVGVGGIGGALTELVARAAAFSNLASEINPIEISLMDADLVEKHNLPHQRFSTRDIGRPKVEALANQLRDAGVSIVLYPLSAFRAMSKAALNVYQTIADKGSQTEAVNLMQTRDELYETLDYHSYETKLDKLFSDISVD